MSQTSVVTLLSGRAVRTWLVLVAATVISFTLGVEHGTGSAIVVAVLALAAVKIRLVGLDFMEIRHAPLSLRAVFESYCVVLWAVLSGLYLWL